MPGDFNFGEIVIIALVALVVVGPRNLPGLANRIGGWVREARSMANEFRLGIEREISELDDVKEELTQLGKEIADPLKEVGDELARPIEEANAELSRGITEAQAELAEPIVDEPVPDDEQSAKRQRMAANDLKPLAWTGPVTDRGPSPDDAAADFDRIHTLGEDLLADRPPEAPAADHAETDETDSPASDEDQSVGVEPSEPG